MGHRFGSDAGGNRRALRRILASAATIALIATPSLAHAEDETASSAEIVVTGVNAPTTSSTGLPLTFMETPQSVTIIDQKRIQDFALTNIRDLLDQVVGVNVQRAETDRTTFDARGFDVTNFQIDGIGLPLIGNLYYGETDSFLYERIDIIRGANGLTTGIGNPSATINYVRKRPLDELHVNVAAHVGSWNKWRGEADISVPLNDKWGLRVMGAHEETDSYLDRYHLDRSVYGAVVSGKLTEDLTLTAGYHRQDNNSKAPTWGSLVLVYSDGTFIDYDRSANSAPSWSKWPLTEQQAYGELAYTLGDWEVKGILTYRRYQDAPLIDIQYFIPNPAGEGYYGDSSQFRTDNKRFLADLYASGSFQAFGQEHKLTFGASYARSRQKQFQGRVIDSGTGFGDGFFLYPNFVEPFPFEVPLLPYRAPVLQQRQIDKLTRLYVASQINITDSFHVVAGASWAKIESGGTNYGEVVEVNQSELNPYAGVLYDITDFLTVYASYTKIFNPQTQYDVNHRQLDPVKGTNMEAGIKANLLDKRLYASATIFKTKQEGLASYLRQEFDPEFGNFFAYEGVDTTAKGFELEMAGSVTPNWQISGGFTKLSIKDQAGAPTRLFVPRETLKLSSTYTMPEWNEASFGAQLRWQNTVNVPATGAFSLFPLTPVTIRQEGYAILDLMVGVDIVENVRATLNVRNVTNKLYYNSLAYGSSALAFYGAGRNFNASVSYRF